MDALRFGLGFRLRDFLYLDLWGIYVWYRSILARSFDFGGWGGFLRD